MGSCRHDAWPVLGLHSGSAAEKTKVRGYVAFCFRSIILDFLNQICLKCAYMRPNDFNVLFFLKSIRFSAKPHA